MAAFARTVAAFRTPNPFRWLVLAAGLSPYTLDLWEEVAAVPGHEVSLFHVPRPRKKDFRHEDDQLMPERVRLYEATGLRSTSSVIAYGRRWRPNAIICMGYSAAYSILATAALRPIAPNALALYASDTNALDLLERSARNTPRILSLLARRKTLGAVFHASFDLGTSNTLAHRALGIRRNVPISLLATRSPYDEGAAEVPSELLAWLETAASPKLVCAARLVERKNTLPLATAWAHHIQKGGSGSFCFVGDGPLDTDLRRVTAPIPADRVRVAGAVPYRQARRLMRHFDGSVLLSAPEPWGIAVIESLMAGVPVLAGETVGAAWSLAQVAPGAIHLAETSEAGISAALERFLPQLPLMKRAALEAQPTVTDKYEVGRVARRLAGGAWAESL